MRRHKLLFMLLMAKLLVLTLLYFFLPLQATNAAPAQVTNITCQISSQTVTYGKSVNISGRLTDALTGAGLKRMINLTYSEDNGTSWTQLKEAGGELYDWGIVDIWTTEDGYYGPYAWKPVHVPHKILVKASWSGDATYEASESTIQMLQVELPPNPPVVVLNQRSYSWFENTLWVTGEVQNVGSKNLKWVRVTITYYTENGTILGIDDAHAQMHLLVPGQKSPFITYAQTRTQININDIASHTVVVRSYEETIEEPYTNIQTINPSNSTDVYGSYHVSGEVKNNGTVSVSSPEVVATFYAANGTVLDAWFDIYLPDILNPNDTTGFDVELNMYRLEVIGSIDHFVLQVDCYPIDIYAPDWTIRIGQPATVFAYLPYSLEQTNITLTYTKPDSTVFTKNVTINEYGYFNDTLTPDQTGVWSVFASWPGEMGNPGKSSVDSFTISKAFSSISFSAPSSIRLGESITVTGSLSPALKERNVTLTFTKPDNSKFTESVLTTSGGQFSYTFQPENVGTWHVNATWSGDANYEETSSSRSFFVEEFVVPIVPVRETPPPENAAVAVATGAAITVGFAGVMSISGLGQSLNAAISRLNVPDWFKDFLQVYSEEMFETLTKEEIEAREKVPLFTKREIVTIILSAAIITMVFGYVEANGLPQFLSLSVFASVIPSVLSTVAVISVAGTLFTALSSRICKVRTEFKVWLYGVIAFLISGLLFLVPFAGPSRSVYQCGEISKKTKGLLVLSKMLLFLTLSIPFSLLFLLGFKTLGDTGLLISLTTVCYSLIPIKPLDGKEILDFDKKIWLATFVPVLLLFIGWVLHLLPHVIYLVVGLASTFIWIITFQQAKSKK